jgi:hypothetical protein
MKLIADIPIELPFKIDMCARGPDVEPLQCALNGFGATLYFPPSLGEDTDGQGIFGEWAWWTGRTLRLAMERELADTNDPELLRAEALATANEILKRFLNAYRWRLNRPEVHPVAIDPRSVSLEIIDDAGRREALPEPVAAFFYQNMPSAPPLENSISASTLLRLQTDVQDGVPVPLNEQLRLDAEALEGQGERERAASIRRWIADIR